MACGRMAASYFEQGTSGKNHQDLFSSTCKACGIPLHVPWIRCVGCSPRVDICSQCFSYGAEFGRHENDHPYTVVTFSFSIFEESWTAEEELQLLEAIQECGLGNWQTVSQRVRTKSETECESHYFKHYVENPDPVLPEFPDNKTYDPGAPIIYKLSDNPPRPPEGSALWSDMAGYSAARGDFAEEYDNFVEKDIARLDVEDCTGEGQEGEGSSSALVQDLKFAVIDVYRNCLKERQRRKKIIRDYGLINIKRLYVLFWRKFEAAFSMKNYRPFMKLFPAEVFDRYLESLNHERQVKQEILRLQEYRKNGIKRLHSTKTYRLMKQRREASKLQRGLLSGVLNHIQDESLCQAWLAKQAAMTSTSKATDQPLPNAPRKAAPPLHIEDLPGYEKLNKEERELCASVRLVPAAYLDFSKILIAECRKMGAIKLAQARTMIKIDVNKTRKLFDFLIQQGMINKDHL